MNTEETLQISDKKLLARAKTQAQSMVASVLVYCQTKSWNVTWADIEARFGLSIPDIFKKSKCDITSIKYGWGAWYVSTVAERLKESPQPAAEKTVLRIYELKGVKDRVRWKRADAGDDATCYLAPEQEAVYRSIVRDMFEQNKVFAAYNDGATGSGKTVLGVAIVKYIIENNLISKSPWIHGFGPILIVCPKGIKTIWERHCIEAGLENYLNSTIIITSYSALVSSYGHAFIKEVPDKSDPTGMRTRYKWNLACIPYFVILDEAHKLNRDSKQTKIFISLFEENLPIQVRSLWLSATPWTVVDHIKAFAIATRKSLLGITATSANFPQFARLITSEPSKPSVAAAKRIRELFAPNIYSFPRVKWAHKAINLTYLVDFQSDHDREIYETAYTRFLERCKKLGRGTNFGRFEAGIALMQFRVACEPLRMMQIVDICHEYVGKYAPVIGCAFLSSVVKAVFRLIEKGYKREDVSIIIGGKGDIKPEYVLTAEQMNELIRKSARGEELTKRDLKCLETTIAFREDQLLYNERLPGEDRSISDARTAERHRKLREFGILGRQTVEKRQIEIDRFQRGESKICIFTLAAGGVGLSLDQSNSNLLPRIGFFTPTYSGAEFRQALGRCLRRFTLSDVVQYIVGIRGTVEETHVLPLIEEKLKCLARVTDTDYDIVNTLMNPEVLEKYKLGDLRTAEQAKADAENLDTQIQIIDDTEEGTSEDDEDI